jgi:hypothetical protein
MNSNSSTLRPSSFVLRTSSSAVLRRVIHPETRVLDAKAGLAEYVASDATIDSYREIILADGWRFNRFEKNAPFVDSHNYDSIAAVLGKVVDFKVADGKLIETVQWAKDVPENSLAQLGWKMTEAGFLKAVSVGFWPVQSIWNGEEGWKEASERLGLAPDSNVRRIYLEQEQIELSAVVLGANPNAVARCFKAGALTEADLDTISQIQSERETAGSTDDPAVVELARQRAREEWLRKFQHQLKQT